MLTPAEVEDYLDAAERLGYLPMFLLALTAGGADRPEVERPGCKGADADGAGNKMQDETREENLIKNGHE